MMGDVEPRRLRRSLPVAVQRKRNWTTVVVLVSLLDCMVVLLEWLVEVFQRV